MYDVVLPYKTVVTSGVTSPGITTVFQFYVQLAPIHPCQQCIGLNNLILTSMGIPVHGGAYVRVTGNGLKGLDIQVRCRHRYVRVPEHMRGGPMHVNGTADAFPAAFVGCLCDRELAAAQYLPFYLPAACLCNASCVEKISSEIWIRRLSPYHSICIALIEFLSRTKNSL